jgi:hypothetical protein
MAKKGKNPNLQDVTNIDTDLFAGGMTKDPNASIVSKEQWTHARNAIPNSDRGDLGAIGNEPSNLLCSNITYPVIGTIYLYGDKWVIFSTNNVISEIGIFDDSECKYEPLVNDGAGPDDACPPEHCLNFSQYHLITGASKENFDCTWQIYWDDGNNPSRTMNITNIPWKTQRVENGDCVTYEPIQPLQIDCDLIRLAPLLDTPRLKLSKSDNGGQLRNGTYQAFMAYTVNGQQIGDYIGISNVQSLFDHEDMVGSLDLTFKDVDKGEFEEFKLVILSNWQSEQQAKEIGLYSVETTHVSIDYINQGLPTVPIELLPLRNPAYEKSEKMYVVNDYLVRSGPTDRFDFNYQPLANQIETFWTSTEYPADYYANGGNKTNFMRDEVYSFFIRWVYDTGEKSSSYHIPGRPASNYTIPTTLANTGINSVLDDTGPGDPNCLDVDERIFQTYNSAAWGNFNPIGPFQTDDGGQIQFMGSMAYWESTERYPMDPVRWNANIGDPELDLCGQPIRHHKFPDEQCFLQAGNNSGTYQPPIGPCTRNGPNSQTIRVLGVKFGNIHLPRLNPETVQEECSEEETGVVKLVPGIVGYEILVGSRAGNKSIIAKGIARNMRQHRLPPDAVGNPGSHETQGGVQAVHANYPFNDVGCDPFLHNPGGNDPMSTDGLEDPPEWAYGRNDSQGVPHPASWTKTNMWTFHSPETSFDRPFLSPWEIRSYGKTSGGCMGIFKKSEKHPAQKLLNTFAAIISIIVGVGYAIAKTRGKRRVNFEYPQTHIPLASASAGGAAMAAAGLAGGNALGLAVTQAGSAVSESVHSGSAILGAPGYGQEAANLMNTGTAWGAQALMTGGSRGGGKSIEYDRSGSFFSELPTVFQPIYGVIAFMQSTAEGGNHILELIYNLCSYVDYAYKYNGHGLYRDTHPHSWNDCYRTRVEKARYVKNTITNLTSTVRMNNLFRPATVAILGEDEDVATSHIIESPTISNISGFPLVDNSRHTGTMPNCYFPSQPFMKNIAAHYVGLKLNFENQYGQIDQIKQIPITNSEHRNGYHLIADYLDKDENDEIIPPDINTTLWSLSLYGGDTYINRYTEKVIMPFFWDFLKGQPDGFVYDYRLRANVMFPMFWANFERYDLSKMVKWITDLSFLDTPATVAGAMPYGYYHLDNCEGGGCGGWNTAWGNDVPYFADPDEWGDAGTGDPFDTGTGAEDSMFGGDGGINLADFISLSGSGDTSPFGEQAVQTGSGTPVLSATDWSVPDDSGDNRRKGLFHIKDGYFYTHSSGINDFFVESEYNIGYRDYEDTKFKRHYDWLEYTDVNTLFDADVLSAGNFYKYDKALSISNLVTQQISSGEIQPRYYDPQVAETCWTHYPKRLIYSLQAQKEATKDFWRVFLPNNYKDFKNKVNVIKPISKSGAVILFPHLAPVMWQGVDQLQTDLGTKITIGDGGLFSQPQQNLVNADLPHEYGSCESSRGVINTPAGLFYISQVQGKIFQMAGQGLTNIADQGMKQWFNQYLPSKLIQDFPELEHHPEWSDNPVAGIGCQAVYDPNFDLVYFCKKDYKLISNPDCIEFVPGQGFVYNATLCEDAPQTPCCPEGFSLIPEISPIRCSREWWEEPDYNTDSGCAEPYDIIMVVYGGDRIYEPNGGWEYEDWNQFDPTNENEYNPAKQTLVDMMTTTFNGLSDSGMLGPDATDSQVMVMQFDEKVGLANHYLDYTGNLGSLLNFANNVYMDEDAQSDGIMFNPPDGSNPSGALWWALEFGYRKGRPGVKKFLIEVWAAYDSVCNSVNFSGVNDNEYPTLVDCNSCGYAGFDSPAGYTESGTDYTPIATAMTDIIADNIGEPGSLGFDRGINDYNMNNSWWTPGGTTETLFVGPVCSPQEQGYYDSYLDWKNDNVFDPTCKYQDPNHPDFDGELTCIGVWFAPWNYMKCENDGASNNGCAFGTNSYMPAQYPNNHPDTQDGNWNVGALPTQGNIDYTVARSSPNHAIWSPLNPGQNNGAGPQYGVDVGESILGLIPCEEVTEDSISCPSAIEGSGVTCIPEITEAGQELCYCWETDPTPIELYTDTLVDISLTDELYFEDVSWTVSYDAKTKAWISFHDWHPELVMPSHRHFLTTKSWVSEEPICPPGFDWNPVTQMCEKDGLYYGLDSIINVDDIKVASESSTQITKQKIDIVFALDVTGSTINGATGTPGNNMAEVPPDYDPVANLGEPNISGTVYEKQLLFIDAFIEAIADDMTAGNVQVSVMPWTTNTVYQMQTNNNVDGIMIGADVTKLDLTDNPTAARNYLGIADGFTNPNFPVSGFLNIARGATNIFACMNAAKGGLDYILYNPTAGSNGQGNSYLGSRQGEEGFERWAFMISDAAVDNTPNQSSAYIEGTLDAYDGNQDISIDDQCWPDGMRRYFWNTGDTGYYAYYFDSKNMIAPNVNDGFANGPPAAPVDPVFPWYSMTSTDLGIQGLIRDIGLNQVESPQSVWEFDDDGNIIGSFDLSDDINDYARGADPTMNIKTRAVFASALLEAEDDTPLDYLKVMFIFTESMHNAMENPWPYAITDDYGSNTLPLISADGVEYLDDSGQWQTFAAIADGIDSYQIYLDGSIQDTLDNILPLAEIESTTTITAECPPDRTLVWINGLYYTSPYMVGSQNKAVCRKVTCECDPIIVEIANNTGQTLNDPDGTPPVESPYVIEPDESANVVGDCPDFDPLIYMIGDPNFSFWDVDYTHPHCCITDVCEIDPNYDRGGIWKHNVRCDSFANYYYQDYPWEIEWVENTGQHVYTLRNVEYQMEAYLYKGALPHDCGDRFHDLDWNFDEAIIYNTEQVSGLLKFNLTPKNDVPLITQYPIVGANDIEILYSKEEQKYRFNQFWDITYDRGEFNPGISNSIYLTQLNGYIRDLNTQNLNYNKNALQRKKFRHYWNKVVLRKNVSGDRKMILKLANTKLNQSHR